MAVIDYQDKQKARNEAAVLEIPSRTKTFKAFGEAGKVKSTKMANLETKKNLHLF